MNLEDHIQLYVDVDVAGTYLRGANEDEICVRILDFEDKLKRYEQMMPVIYQQHFVDEIENYKSYCRQKRKEQELLGHLSPI